MTDERHSGFPIGRIVGLLLPIALVILSSFQLQAGTIDKAFEALDKKDYFKARELFRKLVKKDPLPGNYGLCMVYVTRQNPFYNLDTARIHALRTESSWKLASEKEREKMSVYGISANGVIGLRVMVYMYATDEAKETGTVQACDDFVRRFPSAPQKKEILDLKASVAFNEARSAGSHNAINRFIKEYPNAPETIEAKTLYERFLFEEETREGTAENFRAFISEHPGSPYIQQAQDRLYELSTGNATVETMYAFIREHPENPHVNEAWRKLFRLFSPELSPETLGDFRLTYPDYPFSSTRAKPFLNGSASS